jgi:hypothetical protein
MQQIILIICTNMFDSIRRDYHQMSYVPIKFITRALVPHSSTDRRCGVISTDLSQIRLTLTWIRNIEV